MSSDDIRVPEIPELLPVLSRGKHRTPRKGACFMELASYLAGERWSDHPGCTHQLLSATARDVNDWTTDAGRPRLGVLIPSVIGLVSDDLHVDARIALRCATTALPVVAHERQRVMAVSVLTCNRVLAALDGRPAGEVEAASQAVLAQAPDVSRWAHGFTRRLSVSPKTFRKHSAPSIVHYAVEGIARACVPDPDGMLRDLLVGAIDDTKAVLRHDTGPATLESAELVAACRRAGVSVA